MTCHVTSYDVGLAEEKCDTENINKQTFIYIFVQKAELNIDYMYSGMLILK